MIKKVILICLCLANMFVITYFSSQNAEKSTATSQNVTGIAVKIISMVTGMSEAEVELNIEKYDKYTRSFAHFFLFLALGTFVALALKEFDIRPSFLYAFAVCFAYAIFDELYQGLSISGRAFQAEDLLKDWAGSLTGIFAAWLLCKICRKAKA